MSAPLTREQVEHWRAVLEADGFALENAGFPPPPDEEDTLRLCDSVLAAWDECDAMRPVVEAALLLPSQIADHHKVSALEVALHSAVAAYRKERGE